MADPQVSIRSLLRSKLPPEKVVKLIESSISEALNAEKPEWIECRKCGTKTAVVLPNLDVRVRAASALLGELEGKVGTRQEPPQGPKVKIGDLAELSDDDLLALLHTPEEPSGEPDGD